MTFGADLRSPTSNVDADARSATRDLDFILPQRTMALLIGEFELPKKKMRKISCHELACVSRQWWHD